MIRKCFMLIRVLCLLAALVSGSCSTGDAGVLAMMGGSSQALLYLGSRTVSEHEVEFDFSQPVTIKQLTFEPNLSVESVENGSTVRVTLDEAVNPGILLIADLLAEDEKKNTINVLTSFRSRNNRMPDLIINELCTEYSNPKTEFIEFRIKSDGNLGAMRVFISGNSNASKQTIYEFKPVEVKKDDIIVLHLRTVEESVKDEYTSNLEESGGKNATPTARDFWIPENTKRVHKEAAAIYALDQDDRVLCAIMVSTETSSWWGKEYFAEIAGLLFSQGIWQTSDGKIAGPVDAVRSTGTTNTRTICRDETIENTNTASDWYVTVTSGATPGRPNNTGRY
ncbi:MAG: hypothetical protein FWB86_01600 [Treponema sp.]|nr:hypothetical protein [Treponema sp.]MCL2250822.1 hypothetical protein [Treponema sp.]